MKSRKRRNRVHLTRLNTHTIDPETLVHLMSSGSSRNSPASPQTQNFHPFRSFRHPNSRALSTLFRSNQNDLEKDGLGNYDVISATTSGSNGSLKLPRNSRNGKTIVPTFAMSTFTDSASLPKKRKVFAADLAHPREIKALCPPEASPIRSTPLNRPTLKMPSCEKPQKPKQPESPDPYLTWQSQCSASTKQLPLPADDPIESDDPNGFSPNMRRFYFGLFCLNFMFCAISVNLQGPTLSALSVMMNCTVSDLSHVVVIRTAFYGLASFCTKYLYKYTNRHLLYGGALAVYGVGTAAIPFCKTYHQYIGVASFIGLANAVTDSATILNVLQMYSKKSMSQIQIIYFFFAFGSFAGPLLAGKFLPSHTTSPNIFSGPVFGPNENPYALVYIPFLISGTLLLISCIIIFTMQCFKPFIPFSRKMNSKAEDQANETAQKLPRSYFMVVIVLSLLQMALVCTLEQVCGMFLGIYLTNGKMKMGMDISSYVIAACGLAFTTGRLINIYLTKLVPTKALQAVFMLLVLSGYVILGLVEHGQTRLVWMAAVFIGFGESPVYPLTMSFLEKRASITNSVQMANQISSTFSFMLSMFIVGAWVPLNPNSFVYICWGLCVTTIMMFIIMNVTDLWKRNLQRSQENEVLVD